MPRKVSQFQPLFAPSMIDMHRVETLESRAAAMDALARDSLTKRACFLLMCREQAIEYRARADALRATLDSKES
jgi:hypothetical protein